MNPTKFRDRSDAGRARVRTAPLCKPQSWSMTGSPPAPPCAPQCRLCEASRDVSDEVFCLRTPERFYAVGLWYADFLQTLDNEVTPVRFSTKLRRRLV